MDLKDQGRREPTLADLEAFERLLRDSLHTGPKPDAPTAPAFEPLPKAPDLAAFVPEPGPRGLDANAMAELTRLIEAPLPFGNEYPAQQQTAAPPAPQVASAPEMPYDWSQRGQFPALDAAIERTVVLPHPPVSGGAPANLDPLSDFEAELRRFDDRPQISQPVDYPELRADYPGTAEPTVLLPGGMAQPEEPVWQAAPEPVTQSAGPLDAADKRLAAEAALAAAAAGAVGAAVAASASKGRSRTVFYGLGAVAALGLTVVGATFLLGDRKPNSGGIPVVAAKQEPTKEKPADPGGKEIPDQNRQVLAPKTAAEPPKPAQAVNNTEQPLDLNQVTRRDNVRVIAPNPLQPNTQGQAPTVETNAPTGESSSEPRRVQSVRIGEPAPPPVAQPTTPGISPGAIAAGAAGAAAIGAVVAGAARTATPAPATPSAAPPPNAPRVVTSTPLAPQRPAAQPPTMVAPPLPAPVAAAPAAPAPAAPPKVETRPTSAVAAAPANPPRPATPAAAPAPRPTPPAAQAPTPRPANAPLPLTNNRPQQQASAPASAGGGWSIQLASRPTADDARSAASQLGSRFSGALGGRAPGVVSGEANGRTVYRVRASGYSQADANAACDRVKAAGGQCFVTR